MLKLTQVESSLEDRVVKKEHWDQLINREGVGFFDLPNRVSLWKAADKRAAEIKESFRKLVVLGIGGSSLGGRTLLAALAPASKDVEFIENVDPCSWQRRVEALGDLSQVHFVVVSKSGSTMETLSVTCAIKEVLISKSLFKNHCFTVVSDAGSNPLTEWARQNDIRELHIPSDIGGRFSVFTAVGLLPAAFAGINLEKLRAGGSWALQNQEFQLQLASALYLSFSELKKSITVLWSYSDDLLTFGLWFQQLWAESLAKTVDRKNLKAPWVSTPLPLVGTNDQHSVLQQVAEGTKDKFALFLEVASFTSMGPKISEPTFRGLEFMKGRKLGELLQAEALATRQALSGYGVPTAVLQIEELSPECLGALIMSTQLAVGLIGEIMEINAYDQPGVELGKKLAKKLLAESER